jgi:hypothetical protein
MVHPFANRRIPINARNADACNGAIIANGFSWFKSDFDLDAVGDEAVVDDADFGLDAENRAF